MLRVPLTKHQHFWISNVSVQIVMKRYSVSDAVCYKDCSFGRHPRLCYLLSIYYIYILLNTIYNSQKYQHNLCFTFLKSVSSITTIALQSMGNCSAQHPRKTDYLFGDSDLHAQHVVKYSASLENTYLQILELSSVFSRQYV